MNDLTFLPAVQMAEQIRHRKISPVELVEAHLRKIKKLNPVLNAFVQVDAEGAFRQAREAEVAVRRSEEHTSELQSQSNLVCRLLLEKKKIGLCRNLAAHTTDDVDDSEVERR